MMNEKVLTRRGKKAVWAPAPAGVGGGGNNVTLYAVALGNKALIRNIPSNWYDIFDRENFTAPFMEDVLSVDEQIVAFNKAYDAFYKDGEVKLLVMADGIVCLRAVIAVPKMESDGEVTPARMVFTAYMKSGTADASMTVGIECTENGVSIT